MALALIMDKNYSALMDALKNDTKQDKIFEDMKEWYKQQGLDVYYIAMNEHRPENVKMYELVSYCNVDKTKFGKSKSKNTKLMSDAFDYFLTLCEKYDIYIDTMWLSTMIYHKPLSSVIKLAVLEDFCAKELEKLKHNYKIVDIKDNATILVVFKNDDVFNNYVKDNTIPKIEQQIKTDFNEYIKQIDINEDLNIEVDVNYSVPH